MSDLEIERPWEDALRVRFSRPARRNALTLPMVESLHDLLTDHPREILVLGSTTPGIFCGGADLDVDDASRTRLSDLLYACYEQIVTRPGMVIAVVEGAAVGGGAQLSTAADLRVVTGQARWRWVGPGHGLAVGSWILPELVGRTRALDLCLTSRWLGAREAVAAGLAERIESDPWARVDDLVRELSAADPAALARVKQVATPPSLLEQLGAEREQNRSGWDGHAPAPQGHSRGPALDEPTIVDI